MDDTEFPVFDWNDMRKFNEDHDEEWFAAEEEVLAKKYGGNFIKLKYSDHGRVVYFCELCLSECNAKVSLETHCSGMKHLKKKDVWEKADRPVTSYDDDDDDGPPPPPSLLKSKRKKEKSTTKRQSRSRSPLGNPQTWSKYDVSQGKIDKRDNWKDDDLRGQLSRRVSRRNPDPALRDFDFDGPKASPEVLSKWNSDLERKADSNYNPSSTSNPAESVLQKMSQCSIQTPEDFDFGLRVLLSLLKSLKHYSELNGDMKIAELYMEADMKISTIRALNLGMRMLTSFAEIGKPAMTTQMKTFDKAEDFIGEEEFARFPKPPDSFNHPGSKSAEPHRFIDPPDSFGFSSGSEHRSYSPFSSREDRSYRLPDNLGPPSGRGGFYNSFEPPGSGPSEFFEPSGDRDQSFRPSGWSTGSFRPLRGGPSKPFEPPGPYNFRI